MTAVSGLATDLHLSFGEKSEHLKRPTEADLGAYSHAYIDLICP